jgi:hypothetical protein
MPSPPLHFCGLRNATEKFSAQNGPSFSYDFTIATLSLSSISLFHAAIALREMPTLQQVER